MARLMATVAVALLLALTACAGQTTAPTAIETPAGTTGAATTQSAAPSPTPAARAYTAEVDLYSGRPNPGFALTGPIGDELYADLDARAGEFAAAEEPAPRLGFRGFVVRPFDESQPVVRVTEDAVYTRHEGGTERLADPERRYYRMILADIGPRLPAEIRDTLPPT
jgi:hypothetical protein